MKSSWAMGTAPLARGSPEEPKNLGDYCLRVRAGHPRFSW